MKNFGWGWPPMLLAAFIGGALLGAAFLTAAGQVMLMNSFDFTGQTAAAWVQAIGSIGAILSAVFIVRYQIDRTARLHRDLEARAERRQLLKIWNAVYRLRVSAEVRLLDEDYDGTSFDEVTKGLIEQLRAMRFVDVHEPKAFLYANQAVAIFDIELKNLANQTIGDEAQDVRYFRSCLSNLLYILRREETNLASLLHVRGIAISRSLWVQRISTREVMAPLPPDPDTIEFLALEEWTTHSDPP